MLRAKRYGAEPITNLWCVRRQKEPGQFRSGPKVRNVRDAAVIGQGGRGCGLRATRSSPLAPVNPICPSTARFSRFATKSLWAWTPQPQGPVPAAMPMAVMMVVHPGLHPPRHDKGNQRDHRHSGENMLHRFISEVDPRLSLIADHEMIVEELDRALTAIGRDRRDPSGSLTRTEVSKVSVSYGLAAVQPLLFRGLGDFYQGLSNSSVYDPICGCRSDMEVPDGGDPVSRQHLSGNRVLNHLKVPLDGNERSTAPPDPNTRQ